MPTILGHSIEKTVNSKKSKRPATNGNDLNSLIRLPSTSTEEHWKIQKFNYFILKLENPKTFPIFAKTLFFPQFWTSLISRNERNYPKEHGIFRSFEKKIAIPKNYQLQPNTYYFEKKGSVVSKITNPRRVQLSSWNIDYLGSVPLANNRWKNWNGNGSEYELSEKEQFGKSPKKKRTRLMVLPKGNDAES